MCWTMHTKLGRYTFNRNLIEKLGEHLNTGLEDKRLKSSVWEKKVYYKKDKVFLKNGPFKRCVRIRGRGSELCDNPFLMIITGD